jgi:protein ImuB
MLWVALQFHALPSRTLEPLAAWVCQFTPRVSLEPPQALLAEVQGSLRYFGGMSALLDRLRGGLAELGHEASIAVAATPRAALWRAQGGKKVLEDVPVEIACTEEAARFLRSAGISTIGELLRLPRDGLAKRCGQTLLDNLDRARGELPEPREYFALPARFDASLEFPREVGEAEGVLFAARRLLVQLEGLLAARQAGVRSFVLTLSHRERKTTRLTIPLASPSHEVERFARVLRERLQTVSLMQPVDAIRLEAADFTPLQARSAGLFGDAQAEDEEWARLAERLQARLGADAIHGLTTQPDHRPEYAWRRVEPGEWDPREFIQPGPRPLWLLKSPRRLAKMDCELMAGPERIECGWWDGDEAKRDYFVARSSDTSVLWVYREAGEWFVHGLFA